MIFTLNRYLSLFHFCFELPFKEISFCSSFEKYFDTHPKQKLYQPMLSFALNL